jgi:hypothetical protein
LADHEVDAKTTRHEGVAQPQHGSLDAAAEAREQERHTPTRLRLSVVPHQHLRLQAG